ncbi:O-succinylbenzoic acid--CoA ligase [Ereboglobus sp. PH5-5]|uniref:AMP-binding protein n=1 Tax=Ereboglobus sp. PH5-5 TaxID=2940529 RepID=UPI0024063156|nr:AMP-binding protein [Ereboglobus sp. PH5-5]MDF9833164.1 O-succinylbenzoic acid--CoA ligase [Ereboglobus sp. PH5-5]
MERAELMRVAEATGCAVRRGGFVFLCDPKWGARETAQFERFGKIADAMDQPGHGWLCLPTGGTSGELKFARHDERTLAVAVSGFCKHFEMARVNAVDVLPAHHVSSFMSRVRCAATCGEHLPWDWKEIDRGNYPREAELPGGWVVSLVPTQLQRLLVSGERALFWLHQFRCIFVGGGPVWPQLVQDAAHAKLPVVLSYGMTETGAMVTAQGASDFLETNDRSSGRAMPHVNVEIVDAGTGLEMARGQTGLVQISGESLFYGYFPDGREMEIFRTEDMAHWDARGCLNIVGRRDAVIITGGKKVMPVEVMEVLRTSGVFTDVAVIGVPDPKWGQRVVACYPARSVARLDMRRVESALHSLAKYKWPKSYVPVAEWPRNAQGKLNRAALVEAALGTK